MNNKGTDQIKRHTRIMVFLAVASLVILLYRERIKVLVWFGLILYVPVNSYGHVGMVTSPNHTFSLASLTKRLTSTSCTYSSLATDNNPS